MKHSKKEPEEFDFRFGIIFLVSFVIGAIGSVMGITLLYIAAIIVCGLMIILTYIKKSKGKKSIWGLTKDLFTSLP